MNVITFNKSADGRQIYRRKNRTYFKNKEVSGRKIVYGESNNHNNSPQHETER